MNQNLNFACHPDRGESSMLGNTGLIHLRRLALVSLVFFAGCAGDQKFGNTTVDSSDEHGEYTDQTTNEDGQTNAEAAFKDIDSDQSSFKVDTSGEILSALISDANDLSTLCQRAFDLESISPNKAVDLSSGKVSWTSTRPDIIKINDENRATIVGSGEVTLIAVYQSSDGKSLKDSVTITVQPQDQDLGFKASVVSPIAPVVTATAIRNGETFSNFVNGRAKGRVRLVHPESNIEIKSVDILVHSTDFEDFIFDNFSKPKKNESTCLWEVEYDIAFAYLYVPEVAEYTGQRMQVNFTAETKRNPYIVNLTATLYPEGASSGSSVPRKLMQTQGFSPARR